VAAVPRPPARGTLAGASTGDLNATFCTTLVDEWVRGGVTDAVVCPGSRSTPMALALAADGRVRVHVHHDERSGAFVALGLGRATGRPAVVLTTSGTAAAELHPALVEADLDRVPLLAVTADRPPELHDVGAPQTVDQAHLYGRSVRWFSDPGPPDAVAAGTWRSLAARSVLEATSSPAGPVHLNLGFREPLVGSPSAVPPGRPDGAPWHGALQSPLGVDDASVEAVVALLAARPERTCRGVLVAGGGVQDPDGVLMLAEALGWPVLADPRSGCRTGHSSAVAHADALLRVDGPLRAADVVVRLGSVPASKVQAQWLRDLTGVQVLVDRDGTWLDPDRTASLVVAAEPGALCRALAGRLPSADAAWLQGWRTADDAVEDALAGSLDGAVQWSEPGVARAVTRAVPDGGAIVVSSSMPVRDVEWFAGSLSDRTVHVNRGANGIDGVVSTAVGVALAGQPTALLIGDVALLHDTNGLLGLVRRDVTLCIVVVDNDGGGIFSFLPQASALADDRFEALFGTPHGVDLEALAHVHGLAVLSAASPEELEAVVAKALTAPGASLVRIATDRVANVAQHEAVHALTADVVRTALS
jgi:2-succinyl-5-enolpyruvyl-6-hydroxy-3-cyclohexene-1-carboxylate synthase